MLSSGIVLLAFIIFTVVEVNPLVQKKQWRETVAFSVLMVIGAVYSIGLILNWPLPNLASFFTKIFGPVTKLIEQLLI